MNENLADEIRKTIESIKDMKIQASDINNHLSILEGMMRADIQKKVEEAYQRGVEDGRNETWEDVKALFQTFGTESACVIMKNDNVHGAIDRLKAYEKQKADDEIDEKITGFLDCNGF